MNLGTHKHVTVQPPLHIHNQILACHTHRALHVPTLVCWSERGRVWCDGVTDVQTHPPANFDLYFPEDCDLWNFSACFRVFLDGALLVTRRSLAKSFGQNFPLVHALVALPDNLINLWALIYLTLSSSGVWKVSLPALWNFVVTHMKFKVKCFSIVQVREVVVSQRLDLKLHHN